MKKRKVTIVTDHFIPDNKAISIRMKYLAQALQSEGFDVIVFTSKISKNIKEFKVQTNIATPASNKDALIIRLFKELLYSMETSIRILFNRSDLYIITSPPFTIAFFAALAVTIKGGKFIFDVRDEYPEVYFSEKLISQKGLIGKGLIQVEHWLYAKAILVTTVTNRILEKIQTKTRDTKKVWLFRNGYAEGIEPGEDKAQSRFTVMFHGNMGKFQHPQLVLNLAERCHQAGKEIHFKIFGWGTQADVFQDRRLPNLEHRGEVSHLEIKEIISTANLGFSFQKEDEISRNSFPSKIYEFIGAGVPTLITPISEAGDFVETNGIGFQFSPDDVDGIFDKLVFLYENPNELYKMRENARQARKTLSRTHISSDFVKRLSKTLTLQAN